MSKARVLANLLDSNNKIVVDYLNIPITWIDYATGFSEAPELLQTIASGDVYEYTYSNGTLYRLVPSGSGQDAFYTTFSGGVLSGLVASKGVMI